MRKARPRRSLNPRMATIRYHRLDIAAMQLSTAADLYMRGIDYLSAITLAGAAGAVLDALVRRAGEESFIDYARRVAEAKGRPIPGRTKYERYVTNLFGVLALKHHAESDPAHLELDARTRAEQAIVRAMADYIELRGQHEPFVRGFLAYLWVTKNGPAVMAAYDANPDIVTRR